MEIRINIIVVLYLNFLLLTLSQKLDNVVYNLTHHPQTPAGLAGCLTKPAVKKSSDYSSDESIRQVGRFGRFFAFHVYMRIKIEKTERTFSVEM